MYFYAYIYIYIYKGLKRFKGGGFFGVRETGLFILVLSLLGVEFCSCGVISLSLSFHLLSGQKTHLTVVITCHMLLN